MIFAAATVELSRAALQHNAKKAREYAPKSKLIAVIKANAYGHGAGQVAKILAPEVDAFAVARLDEALVLRESGIKQRILVLQGFLQAEELPIFQQEQLDAVVHSEYQVELLEKSQLSGRLSVWLKIETGMNRLGVQPSQFKSLLMRLRTCVSVADDIQFMTHFANADDRKDPKTKQQEACFLTTIKGEAGDRSVANSAAIIAWPSAHLEWNRAGLMLYGASPIIGEKASSLGLMPVMTFYARVIAIKQVKKGEAVGYGSSWQAPKDMLLAVISAGYGDGYPRHAKAGAYVLVNNQLASLVGRVSMDMLTVDLTGCSQVNVGDKVTLWGEGLPIDEIANSANTISYTLMCGVTTRVKASWV